MLQVALQVGESLDVEREISKLLGNEESPVELCLDVFGALLEKPGFEKCILLAAGMLRHRKEGVRITLQMVEMILKNSDCKVGIKLWRHVKFLKA